MLGKSNSPKSPQKPVVHLFEYSGHFGLGSFFLADANLVNGYPQRGGLSKLQRAPPSSTRSCDEGGERDLVLEK